MSSVKWAMPAEWDRHERTWLVWPYSHYTWRRRRSATATWDDLPARTSFIGIVTAIASFEPVVVCALDSQLDEVQKVFADTSNVSVVSMSSNDIWVRDTGPTFVVATKDGIQELGGVDWRFNCWGEMGVIDGVNYLQYDLDNQVAGKILDFCNVPMSNHQVADLVMEGGSFHVDGEGTLITTEECLLNPNRNPQLSKAEIESRLKTHLGVEKVIWLPRGLFADEDTNGHVDNFCCFSRPGRLLLAWTDDLSDPQYEISTEALTILEASTDAKGRSFHVTKLPVPPVLAYTAEECAGFRPWGEHKSLRQIGQRLAGSYINFYLTNGGVICPGFGVPTDEVAVRVLQEEFPDRQVVQVPTREILLGGGNIHCITQQQHALRSGKIQYGGEY